MSETAAESSAANGSIYSITLGERLSWKLWGQPGTEEWLARFASIMNIDARADRAYATIAFSLAPSWRPWRQPPPNFPELLSGAEALPNGWRHDDFGVLRLWYHPETVDCVCELKNPKGDNRDILMMWYSLYAIYRGLVEKGGLPVHGALIERGGVGALLVAGEGGGKSTSCRRIPPPWNPRCDDGVVLVPGHPGGFIAHPFPTWSDLMLGRSRRQWNVQKGIPLKAIYFLEKAEKDSVERVGQGQTSIMISESASYICRRGRDEPNTPDNKALRKKLYVNACAPAKEIPAFILHASRNGRFWEQMESVFPA